MNATERRTTGTGRIALGLPVQLVHEGLGEVLPAELRDLSRGGFSIISAMGLAAGAQMNFRIDAMDGRPPIEGTCSVAWNHARSLGNAALGLSFIDVDPISSSRLEEVLDALEGDEESSAPESEALPKVRVIRGRVWLSPLAPQPAGEWFTAALPLRKSSVHPGLWEGPDGRCGRLEDWCLRLDGEQPRVELRLAEAVWSECGETEGASTAASVAWSDEDAARDNASCMDAVVDTWHAHDLSEDTTPDPSLGERLLGGPSEEMLEAGALESLDDEATTSNATDEGHAWLPTAPSEPQSAGRAPSAAPSAARTSVWTGAESTSAGADALEEVDAEPAAQGEPIAGPSATWSPPAANLPGLLLSLAKAAGQTALHYAVWAFRMITPLLQQGVESVRALMKARRSKSRKATAPRRRQQGAQPRAVQASPRTRSDAPLVPARRPLGRYVLGLAAFALVLYAMWPEPKQQGFEKALEQAEKSARLKAAAEGDEAGEQAASTAADPAKAQVAKVAAAGALPDDSPYAVDLSEAEPGEVPAAVRSVGQDPSTLHFGTRDLQEARSFFIRMSRPVELLRGEKAVDGFSVKALGALALDRAGPIAEGHPRVERAMVLNRGDHAELTVRFLGEKTPRYEVIARGAILEIRIAERLDADKP